MIKASITTIVKNLLNPYLTEGIIAVDLTAGNGNDTCFLASKVGNNGKVYAFDIQSVAIENTRHLLEEKGYLSRVVLINDGHENLSQHISEEIHVAMANLGYLPNGDKLIITKPSTTIKAITSTLERMSVGGVMSIVIYYGHEGGDVEREGVQAYLNHLDEKQYDVLTLAFPNRKKKAPIIYFIHKRNVLDNF